MKGFNWDKAHRDPRPSDAQLEAMERAEAYYWETHPTNLDDRDRAIALVRDYQGSNPYMLRLKARVGPLGGLLLSERQSRVVFQIAMEEAAR